MMKSPIASVYASKNITLCGSRIPQSSIWISGFFLSKLTAVLCDSSHAKAKILVSFRFLLNVTIKTKGSLAGRMEGLRWQRGRLLSNQKVNDVWGWGSSGSLKWRWVGLELIVASTSADRDRGFSHHFFWNISTMITADACFRKDTSAVQAQWQLSRAPWGLDRLIWKSSHCLNRQLYRGPVYKSFECQEESFCW